MGRRRSALMLVTLIAVASVGTAAATLLFLYAPGIHIDQTSQSKNERR
jgi:hypothetical protein